MDKPDYGNRDFEQLKQEFTYLWKVCGLESAVTYITSVYILENSLTTLNDVTIIEEDQ